MEIKIQGITKVEYTTFIRSLQRKLIGDKQNNCCSMTEHWKTGISLAQKTIRPLILVQQHRS